VPLCSVCGRREAVYLRRSSGERLCARCLERSMVKRVKRVLSRTRSIGPRDRILVPVLGFWQAKSAALLRLVSIVEKEYPSSLLVALDEESLPCLPMLRRIAVKEASYHALEGTGSLRLAGSPILSLLRAARAVALEAARRLGAGIVMLPPTRDFLVSLLLSSMIRGLVGGLAEHRGVMEVGGVRVVYPLYGVECEDLAFYLHLTGIYDECGSRGPRLDEADVEIGRMVAELSAESRELLFSAQRLENLLERGLEGLSRCVYCGGLDETSPCRACRETGVGEVLRSLRVSPLT
jgi:hypothetical protein